MRKKFTLNGGARIGMANATYFLADLYVDKEILKINASIVGKFNVLAKRHNFNVNLYSYSANWTRNKNYHIIENYNSMLFFGHLKIRIL